MIDVLYVSFNRLEYTVQSFEALLANTDWSLVRRLAVADDGSTDGSAGYLAVAITREELNGVEIAFAASRFGGPVAAMNWFLELPPLRCRDCGGAGQRSPGNICLPCDGSGSEKPSPLFAKVDNDFVVCPGWLNDLSDVMARHQEIDVLGAEPWFGDPRPAGWARTVSPPVRHVGGKGLIRRKIFSLCRPQPAGFNGYQGWTQYQEAHENVVKAWVTPDLLCFGLDQMLDGHYRDLAAVYESQGWGRTWPPYGSDEHYSWWTPVQA